MGRQIKRVPLDFDWPLGQLWHGFVNPHYKNCPKCDGSGETTASKRVGELVRLILLSGEDAKRGKTHPYFEWGALHQTAGITPSPDMVAFSTALAGREPSFFGHDSIDAWRAKKKIVAAAGNCQGVNHRGGPQTGKGRAAHNHGSSRSFRANRED